MLLHLVLPVALRIVGPLAPVASDRFTGGVSMGLRPDLRAEIEHYEFAVLRGPTRVQQLLEVAGFPHENSLFIDDPAKLTGGGV